MCNPGAPDSNPDPPLFWGISLFFFPFCDFLFFSGRVTPKILRQESKNAPEKQGKLRKEKRKEIRTKKKKARKGGSGKKGRQQREPRQSCQLGSLVGIRRKSALSQLGIVHETVLGHLLINNFWSFLRHFQVTSENDRIM